MPAEPPYSVVVADVGKTSIRVEYRPRAGTAVAVEGVATGVLGEPGAEELLLAALAETAARLPEAAREVPVATVGIAGYLTHPELRERVRVGLRGAFPQARLEVTSDLVLAHVGALGGAVGTVLVAGTGAAALAAGAAVNKLADGLGPLLGDEGGGAWIGREGAAAALRAVQGRGPQTLLRGAVEAEFRMPVEDLPGWLAQRRHPVRDLAGLAPAVLATWRQGCDVAAAIATAAAERLAASAAAAHSVLAASDPVSMIGSLARNSDFRELVAAALAAACPAAAFLQPAGNSLDGAALLCGPDASSLPAAGLVDLPRG